MKYKKGSFITVPNRDVLIGLKPHVQSVFIWLCRFADDNGMCFPGKAELSRCAGVGRTRLKEVIKELETIGMIQKTNRRDGKTNKSNLYQIIIVDTDNTDVGHDQTEVGRNRLHPGAQHDPGVGRQESANSIQIELKPLNSIHQRVKDLQPAAADVNRVIDIFSPITQTNLFKNTAQRKAVIDLLAKQPVDVVIRVAKLALQVQGLPYAPSITTPYQLLHKWAQLAFYVKSERFKASKKKITIAKVGGAQ